MVAACDGVNAIEHIQRHRPDVVLLDVQMPQVDGLTILRQLAGWAQPPAVAMLTTFDTAEFIDQALRHGAVGFLLKDTEPEHLVHAVRVMSSGGKVLSPKVTDTADRGPRLVGLRERAELLDGWVKAGPTPDGGFLLKAALPDPPSSAYNQACSALQEHEGNQGGNPY